MSSDHPLPKGASGLGLGELVLALARDMLIFTPKGAREHYTLHLGPNSRVIDVHKTTLREDGTEEHLTLFSITHEQLLTMLEALTAPFLELLMSLARPLNPAWMEKRRVGAIVGLLPTGKEIAAVSRVRRRKFAIDPQKLAARAWAPERLNDLYDIDTKIFTLFLDQRNKAPHKIGYGFAVTDTRSRRRLVWIPDRNVTHAMHRGSALLQDAAVKYGVVAANAKRFVRAVTRNKVWRYPPRRG